MNKITFKNNNPVFHKALKEKVNAYFRNNRLPVSGGWQLLLKACLLCISAITIYITLVFFTPNALLSVLLCALLGCNLAFIGFNIMHEGGHGSFSRFKWLNEASAYALNALGGTIYFWKQRHNVEHHTYTNIEGLDHDIDIRFMRMHKEQASKKYHRFQHIYWVALYGISYVVWVLFQDFEKYFRLKKVDDQRKFDSKQQWIFWITKILYITVYLIIPIITVGFLKAIAGYLIVGIACGFSISMVFQLAHVVEGTQFPEPDKESNKIQKEWAVHQINTTANFSTKSRLVSWFLGGLNFQVEHHLFPGISHIHYRQINRLVKETCKEFGITYLEHKSMLRAFVSHVIHLKKLST
ncbi:fatty acid desaturase family protein [Desertivirga arenae]|uniref:fatty acid desaturase family protein n=1 Tax=Desertivirga arenae TaxID=2810309 RepID=UPI001A979FED|nr:acyl-CoA desaturase [Pedobacter sp. SYSU D00823]